MSAATVICFVVTKSQAVKNAMRFVMHTSSFLTTAVWFNGNVEWDGATPVSAMTKHDSFVTKHDCFITNESRDDSTYRVTAQAISRPDLQSTIRLCRTTIVLSQTTIV